MDVIQSKEAILNFLESKNTEYAFLITGQWGSGKTYFFKTIVSNMILQHNYQSLYISLNGLSDEDQINRRIVIQYLRRHAERFAKTSTLDSITKWSDAVRGLITIAKSAGGKVADISRLVSIDVKPEHFIDTIDFHNYVVCFDDLERAKIETDRLLGYINQFVEHHLAKVIVIANEKKIKESYLELKEKVIGKTVEYCPNYGEVIQSLISSFDEDLKEFLSANLSIIHEFMEKGDTKNFRVLRSALDDFRFLYSVLEHDYSKLLQEAILPLLQFTLALSFELRLGRVKPSDLDSMKNLGNADYWYWTKSKDTEMPYYQKFSAKYYDGKYSPTNYFPSVIEYLDKGVFNRTQFKHDLDIFSPKTVDIVENLYRNGVHHYSDQEYLDTMNEIIKRIATGAISLSLYPRVFYYLEYEAKNNLLLVDTNDLEQLFIDGANNCRGLGKYSGEIDDTVEYFDVKPSDAYFRIKEHVNQINITSREEQEREQTIRIFDELKTNSDAYCANIDSSCGYLPILKYLLPEDIFEHILNSSNKTKQDLINSFRSRHPRVRYDEYSNLVVLSKIIQDYLLQNRPSTNPIPLKYFLMQRIVDAIEENRKEIEAMFPQLVKAREE